MEKLMCPKCKSTRISKAMWASNYRCEECEHGLGEDRDIDNSDAFKVAALKYENKLKNDRKSDILAHLKKIDKLEQEKRALVEALELWQDYSDCCAYDEKFESMTEKDVYDKVSQILSKIKSEASDE